MSEPFSSDPLITFRRGRQVLNMTKNYTASHSLSRPSTGDIRKATFDQRKSDYVRSTHDRPAVFSEQLTKHNDYVRPSRNTQN